MLRFAASEGIDVAAIVRDRPRVSERSFDSAWKFARVTVQEGDGRVSYLKGAPEVPTVIELGYPDTVGQLFVGVLVPSATPKPVVDQIAAANSKVMSDAEFQKILIASGLEPVSDTPERAKAYIAEETQRWAPIVKAIGLAKG